MNWTTVVILIIVLVALDKTLTVMNIKAVMKNNPGTDALSIERNPLAKWFFTWGGLVWGSLCYGIISVLGTIIGLKFISRTLSYWTSNPDGIAVYILVMLYAFVIFNNFYFLLRYNKLL